MARSRKGSAFERWFCRELSLWWSEGKDDDLFWRTAGSGARANVRSRKGKRTVGQHGDIASTDTSSAILTKVLTIELKRGYNKATVADLLDQPLGGAIQKYEYWFSQASTASEQSGTFAWLLVVKRDHREPIVFMPSNLWSIIKTMFQHHIRFTRSDVSVFGVPLKDFFQNVGKGTMAMIGQRTCDLGQH